MSTTARTPASPLWTTTDRDRQRWQTRALRLLDEVHAKGAEAGLPPLMWNLGASGVGGHVSTLGSDPTNAEATLRAWAGMLGLSVKRAEGTTSHLRLFATAEDYGTSRASITISVDLYDD